MKEKLETIAIIELLKNELPDTTKEIAEEKYDDEGIVLDSSDYILTRFLTMKEYRKLLNFLEEL